MSAQTSYRTHHLGELAELEAGTPVKLCGWLGEALDEGPGFELFDRYGRVSARGETPEGASAGAVVQIEGTLAAPEEDAPRAVDFSAATLLSRAQELPIDFKSDPPPEPIERLQYRYLELRGGPGLQRLARRSRLCLELRKHLDTQGFLEIETPILGPWTPDATSAFVVPAGKGECFALSQSPQFYKQLLMVSGCDKYFQLARCFRKETALSPEHQPEFTSFDFEMSHVDSDDIYKLVDGLLARLWHAVLEEELDLPLPRLTYDDALARYGTERPDLRFDAELQDCSDEMVGMPVKGMIEAQAVFGLRFSAEALEAAAPEGSEGPAAEQLDAWLGEVEGDAIWLKVGPDTTLEGAAAGSLEEEQCEEIIAALGASEGDLLVFAAGDKERAKLNAGRLRGIFGKALGLTQGKHAFCWVTSFPYFGFDPDTGAHLPVRHPFTQPTDEGLETIQAIELLPALEEQSDDDPNQPAKGAPLGAGSVRADDPEGAKLLALRSKSFELIYNGQELGTGSVRVHDQELQARIFAMFGYDAEAVARRFGFVLEAFKYGVPPHGGASLGLDRLLMEIEQVSNLGDVQAFPKAQDCTCPMTGSPAAIDPDFVAKLLEG